MTRMKLKTLFFLFHQLLRRDLDSRFRGSSLGWLWAFTVPLIMLAVYSFVFGVVFKVRWGSVAENSETNFALNLFAGIILHGLLAEALNRAPSVLQQHASYVKKIIFPLWLLPVVTTTGALVFAAISGLILLVAFVFMQGIPPLHSLLIPLIVLPLYLFALGGAWFLAALGAYVRDIVQIIPLLTTILMFMAPIFYPASAIPEEYRNWLLLNPLTYAVDAVRNLLFFAQPPGLWSLLAYTGCACLTAAAGLLFFLKVRRGFADVL